LFFVFPLSSPPLLFLPNLFCFNILPFFSSSALPFPSFSYSFDLPSLIPFLFSAP
jgi:hypothetical protein